VAYLLGILYGTAGSYCVWEISITWCCTEHGTNMMLYPADVQRSQKLHSISAVGKYFHFTTF